jgi:hypothetical protein
VLKTLRAWLRNSRRVYIRGPQVRDLPQFVALADRFLDGSLKYPLEWDDFISWTNDNPSIEAIRDRIAETEPLFFSKDAALRIKAIDGLVAERNRAAALCSLPQRQRVNDSA